jgi:hypothetical protein
MTIPESQIIRVGPNLIILISLCKRKLEKWLCTKRRLCKVKGRKWLSINQGESHRRIQNCSHTLNFHSKTSDCKTIHFCCVSHLSLVLCHTARETVRQCHGHSCNSQASCVAQLQFLLKSPGQSHCLFDWTTFCSLWLGLDSAYDTHQSITAITVIIWPKPTLYLMFTWKFCYLRGFTLSTLTHYIFKKYFMNLNCPIGA